MANAKTFSVPLKEPTQANGTEFQKLDFSVPKAKHMKHFFGAMDMKTGMPSVNFQDHMAKLMADVCQNGLNPDQFLELGIDDFMEIAAKLTDFFGTAGKL